MLKIMTLLVLALFSLFQIGQQPMVVNPKVSKTPIDDISVPLSEIKFLSVFTTGNVSIKKGSVTANGKIQADNVFELEKRYMMYFSGVNGFTQFMSGSVATESLNGRIIIYDANNKSVFNNNDHGVFLMELPASDAQYLHSEVSVSAKYFLAGHKYRWEYTVVDNRNEKNSFRAVLEFIVVSPSQADTSAKIVSKTSSDSSHKPVSSSLDNQQATSTQPTPSLFPAGFYYDSIHDGRSPDNAIVITGIKTQSLLMTMIGAYAGTANKDCIGTCTFKITEHTIDTKTKQVMGVSISNGTKMFFDLTDYANSPTSTSTPDTTSDTGTNTVSDTAQKSVINNGKISSTSTVGGINIDTVYKKYCSGSISINYKNTDYSSELISKLSSLKTEDLTSNLTGGVYLENQIPEALQYLGFKLMQENKIDDSLRIYKCDAENYYDMVSMYRMARLYKSGTDSIKQQLPDAVITNNVAIDYQQAYFWVSSMFYVELAEKTGKLSSDTQFGWNTIAMLDDLQETGKLTTTEMTSTESKVRDFISKRYPDVLNSNTRVINHKF